MDISSNGSYPSNKLSNFAGNAFEMDGVKIASMEGFLQSLKCMNPDMQEHICSLVGKAAKQAGSKRNWRMSQVLHWRGERYKRGSAEYQELLDRAYLSMYTQSEGFRKALNMTSGNLTHSLGRTKESETILTRQEFTSRLMKLRGTIVE